MSSVRARVGALAWRAALLIAVACGGRDEQPPSPPVVALSSDPELTADELAQLAGLSPLPKPPPDPTNAFADSRDAARLGQALFFDPALSGPLLFDNQHGKAGDLGRVSCFTCHDGPHMDDKLGDAQLHHLSIGTGRGIRNSPPLTGSVFYRWGNWGGRFDSQWALVVGVIEKPDVMNGSRLAVAHLIALRYRAEYEAVFGTPDPALADRKRFPAIGKPKQPGEPDGDWERMTQRDRDLVDQMYVNAGKAVAAYLRLLVGGGSAFDRFVAGQRDAISGRARRGIKLFLKHCKSCHGGPHFEDGTFRALAVAQFGPHVPASDLGRYDDVPPLLASPFNANGKYSDDKKTGRLDGLAHTEIQRGRFRTPTLRNVALTAPYMHAGQFKTLKNVVTFYNAGGGEVAGIVKDPELKPLKLSDEDQADLVEFMTTLSDEPLPLPLVTPPIPTTLDAALARLRTDKLRDAADVIARRVAQRDPKMKLTADQGRLAATALHSLARRLPIRMLCAVMPRSAVELARAVRDRGVTADEAEAIASYLATVVVKLSFEGLEVFDENHSHVIGREWQDIDYTGENMTWQSQRDDWAPKGVTSFKRAAFIHAYFVGAESLPHWKRVYKPRGKMADVAKP